MKDTSVVFLFIDDEPQPIAVLDSPASFELDTRKLVDGEHTLRIVSKDPFGKEGLRLIPFHVRNGPAIVVEGIRRNAVLDDVAPMMINAYGKGDQRKFLISGSETPQSIPAWIWMMLIGFAGWSAYYLFSFFQAAP